MSNNSKFISYSKDPFAPEEMKKCSKEFYEWSNKRRTVRDFSSR